MSVCFIINRYLIGSHIAENKKKNTDSLTLILNM